MSDSTTVILNRIASGDARAADELLPMVYTELRQLAARRLVGDKAGQSLQATELVHEAFLRLVGAGQAWENNAHFFGAAAEAMRRILVDRARQKKQIKRGGELNRIELSKSTADNGPSAEEVLHVNDLLDRFAEQHPAEAELVKLRYFAGFTLREAAGILGIPKTTAHRQFTYAKSWMFRELQKGNDPEKR